MYPPAETVGIDSRARVRDEDIFTPGFSENPYWWVAAPPAPAQVRAIPARADIAIIGSGYTGLLAALELSRLGRNVAVIEQHHPGYGASSRNAGFLGRTFKKSFSELRDAFGKDYALAIYRELNAALQYVRDVVRKEAIDCHLTQHGRFIAATSVRHYDEMAREFEVMNRALGLPFSTVSRADQRSEIASDIYHGGIVVPDLGAVHPGLLHKGLLAAAVKAGVELYPKTTVVGVEETADGIAITTDRGKIQAKEVIAATNGYTPRTLPWYARRVIPFRGYIAATEILPAELMAPLAPNNRTVLDSNMNINFLRPAPGENRILFGGMTGTNTTSLRDLGKRLLRRFQKIMPDFAGLRLAHVWTGQCAGTFDFMPHLARRGRVWFAGGYNFAGVPMGTYLGMKLAHGIAGSPLGKTVFEEKAFPTVPFYRGNPWFVPAAMRYFDLNDLLKAHWPHTRQAKP